MVYRINAGKGKVTIERRVHRNGKAYWEVCRASDDEVQGVWLFDIDEEDGMKMSELKDRIEERLREIGEC